MKVLSALKSLFVWAFIILLWMFDALLLYAWWAWDSINL